MSFKLEASWVVEFPDLTRQRTTNIIASENQEIADFESFKSFATAYLKNAKTRSIEQEHEVFLLKLYLEESETKTPQSFSVKWVKS